jgi:hypothetical protein
MGGTMRKSCWALTNGEYSDYRVSAIFATEEEAKKALAEYQATRPRSGYWTTYEVEEMSFVAAGSYKGQVNTHWLRLQYDPHGSTKIRVGKHITMGWPWETAAQRRPIVTLSPPSADLPYVDIMGTDAESVYKVASERAAKLALQHECQIPDLRQGGWPTGAGLVWINYNPASP